MKDAILSRALAIMKASRRPSPLEGAYYDPKHGGCLRCIERLDVPSCAYAVSGAYGNDEAEPPGQQWYAKLTVTDGEDSRSLFVDFVGKTPRKTHRALWCPDAREIHWDDGNVWKKLYA